MSTDLEDWRAAMLASVPAYSAFLFATPADRYAASRAVPQINVPPNVPLERPEPKWLKRPPEFPASVRGYLDRYWHGSWIVSRTPEGKDAIEFHPYNGRRVKRMPGRHTKHGRLDVEASTVRLAAYDRAEAERVTARNAIITATIRERTARAVRLGTGWLRVSGINGRSGEHWLIFDPEHGVWWVVGTSGTTITPAEVETLTIIERGPPSRERAPVLTFDEVRAEVEPQGYTVEIDEGTGVLKVPVLRVKWGGTHLISLFAENNLITSIEYRHAATRVNLWIELQRKVASEIARCEKQVQELSAQVRVLRGAP